MNTLRVALAQINPTVGAFDSNTALILDYLERARQSGADLVAFPELAIAGYPPEDLLLKPRFVAENRRALDDIATAGRAPRRSRSLARPFGSRIRGSRT